MQSLRAKKKHEENKKKILYRFIGECQPMIIYLGLLFEVMINFPVGGAS